MELYSRTLLLQSPQQFIDSHINCSVYHMSQYVVQRKFTPNTRNLCRHTLIISSKSLRAHNSTRDPPVNPDEPGQNLTNKKVNPCKQEEILSRYALWRLHYKYNNNLESEKDGLVEISNACQLTLEKSPVNHVANTTPFENSVCKHTI